MKLGICVGNEPEKIKCAADCGFEYLETGFAFFAKESDETIDAYCKCLEENNIRCEAANCFIPGAMKVTGEDVDYDALKTYIEKGMKNGVKAGLKTVVFGSSGARNVPEGFPFAEAVRQLVYFLKEIVAPIADKYDITIVVEPLQRKDTNIINSVKEGAILAAVVDSDRIKSLSDSFHMCSFGDSFDNIADIKGCLGHAHIAEPKDRVFPYENDGADYKTYLDALKAVDCPRCSIEASCKDFLAGAPVAYKVLRAAE